MWEEIFPVRTYGAGSNFWIGLNLFDDAWLWMDNPPRERPLNTEEWNVWMPGQPTGGEEEFCSFVSPDGYFADSVCDVT